VVLAVGRRDVKSVQKRNKFLETQGKKRKKSYIKKYPNKWEHRKNGKEQSSRA